MAGASPSPRSQVITPRLKKSLRELFKYHVIGCEAHYREVRTIVQDLCRKVEEMKAQIESVEKLILEMDDDQSIPYKLTQLMRTKLCFFLRYKHDFYGTSVDKRGAVLYFLRADPLAHTIAAVRISSSLLIENLQGNPVYEAEESPVVGLRNMINAYDILVANLGDFFSRRITFKMGIGFNVLEDLYRQRQTRRYNQALRNINDSLSDRTSVSDQSVDSQISRDSGPGIFSQEEGALQLHSPPWLPRQLTSTLTGTLEKSTATQSDISLGEESKSDLGSYERFVTPEPSIDSTPVKPGGAGGCSPIPEEDLSEPEKFELDPGCCACCCPFWCRKKPTTRQVVPKTDETDRTTPLRSKKTVRYGT